jgi:hypothetical protein
VDAVKEDEKIVQVLGGDRLARQGEQKGAESRYGNHEHRN